TYLPARATGRKAILDDPLRERLGDHGPGVRYPEVRCNDASIALGGGGHDTVDHRGRTGDFLFDKSFEIAIAQGSELNEHSVKRVAIVRKIVASKQSEGKSALLAAPRNRLG